MDTFDAIAARRSIRRFRDTPLPRELVERVLAAAVQAPSGKNRQPWAFIVVQGDPVPEMVRVMREGIERARQAGHDLGSAEWTANAMERAPVTVFVFNPYHEHEPGDYSGSEWSVVDVQSVGAAIQNMLLAAQALGLGTLWICDVFYAYDELRAWLGRKDQLVAAVSIGYPDESPDVRPRKPWPEVTTWVGG